MAPQRKSACKGPLYFLLIALITVLGQLVEEADSSFESLLEYTLQEEQPLIGLALDEHRAPPLFYDTFYPIIYEIPIPSWTAMDMRLDMPLNLTNNSSESFFKCNDTAEDYNNSSMADLWGSTLCPIQLKLNDILDTFAVQLKVFETFNASATKLDSQFSCHEVKPHFSNHIIDEIEMELYLIQVLLDCPMTDVIHHKIDVAQPNKTKYAEIFKMFIETHISPRFRIVGYSKYAIATNILLSLHTTELFDFLLDSFSWTTSINTCNSQRIPRLLIPQEKLSSALKEIEGKIENKDLKLAIPISDISNYYKLQLADCVTTTGKSYIVRVLVPLVKKSVTYKLVRINSIPFLNNEGDPSKTMICEHYLLQGSMVINAKTKQPLAQVKCEEAQLCRVPPEGDRPVFDRCQTSALVNDTKGMLEHCHIACNTYDPIYLPYIKRIRSDQFVIAGTSTADISISCKRETKPVIVKDVPKTIGSLLVTLPCSCYLTHRTDRYDINGPCDFHLSMKPVRPMGWTYDILLEQFHHKKHFIGKPPNNTNNSNEVTTFTEYDDDNDFNEIVFCNQFSNFPSWPIYLAYLLLLIGAVVLAGGFYTLRNVYVRIGQLEMSTALTTTRRPTFITAESEFNRNAPVAYTVNSTRIPTACNISNDSLY